MQRIAFGLALVVVLMTAGCGGGGGGGVGSVGLSGGSRSSTAGTWTVSGLALPNNQLSIGSNGDVLVTSESTRAGAVKIGTCGADGNISLSGSWRSGGTDYSISGNGRVTGATSLSLTAIVSSDGQIIMRADGLGGYKIGDQDFPPPPPDYNTGDGTGPGDPNFYNGDQPPAPPGG